MRYILEERICPNCDISLDPMQGEPPVWKCSKCQEMYGIRNGKFSVIPTKGTLDSWPELKNYFDKIIDAFNEGDGE